MTTSDGTSEGQGIPGGDPADEERRFALAQLAHLDELTPDDEEEISRFRSFAASPPQPSGGGGGGGLGRVLGSAMHRKRAG